jgi:acetyl esterase/lipase
MTNLIHSILHIFQAKKIIIKQFKSPARNTGSMNPEKFNSSLLVENLNVNGFSVLTITTKKSNQLKKHVVFLHGGAYLLEASSFHRKIIETFVAEFGLTVSFIDYPKAPENNFRTTHKIVLEAYLEIVKKNSSDNFFLFGDSAGGGLALAFLQVLREQCIAPFPTKTVLVSPWLDLSMSNKLVNEFEKKDALLSIEGLRYAATVYSNGEDLRNPLLSPLFGNLSNLGEIKLLFGTHEIFHPDCMELVKQVNKATNTHIDVMIGENMMHDWIIFPVPEAKKTIHHIAQFYLT